MTQECASKHSVRVIEVVQRHIGDELLARNGIAGKEPESANAAAMSPILRSPFRPVVHGKVLGTRGEFEVVGIIALL